MITEAGKWLRVIRAIRKLSQRELAEISGVPRSTVERIESAVSIPRIDTFQRLLDATGFHLAIRDQQGRVAELDPERERLVDRAERHFPAHLKAAPTPKSWDYSGSRWWGWERIAWSGSGDWVPENTFWRRYEQLVVAPWDGVLEYGRVWDDAT